MARNKLHVIGELTKEDKPSQFHLRLDKETEKWIAKNCTGSKNSIINLLLKTAVKQIDPILEDISLTEEL